MKRNIIIPGLILLSSLFLSTLTGCVKPEQTRKVSYQISSSSLGFFVNYRNEESVLVKDTIMPQSAQDVWLHGFDALPGHTAFVSAKCVSPSDALNIRILIDGKTYRQGSIKNDSISFVSLSVTVPEV